MEDETLHRPPRVSQFLLDAADENAVFTEHVCHLVMAIGSRRQLLPRMSGHYVAFDETVTSGQQERKSPGIPPRLFRERWSGRGDLNSRPLDPQSRDHSSQPASPPIDRECPGAVLQECWARIGRIRPDLASVVEAWDGLPGAVKAGILAMVRAAAGGDK